MEAKFSDQVKDIIHASGRLAIRFNYDHIDSEHLLLAIVDESLKNENVLLKVLKHFNINLFNLIEAIEASFDKPETTAIEDDQMPFTKSAEAILKLFFIESRIFNSNSIETEHLFLSYLRNNSGFCEKILNVKYNLNRDNVLNYIQLGERD